LHNGELHNLYSSPNIVRVIKSRRMRWAGHVAPMCRWEDNIKMDLRYRWGELDSSGSGYDLVVGFCEDGDEPSASIKQAGYFLIR
jgi:hypothetical protein